MKNKILFILATQYDNMGDLLINKCLVDELANYGEVYIDAKNASREFIDILMKKSNVYELSNISNISLKGKGAFAIPFKRQFRFTHLFKSPGPFGGASSISDKIRYLMFYYIFRVMKYKKCISYLMGVDLIVRSKFDERLQKLYASTVKGLYVRSKGNENLLRSLNISNVKYFPDLCFLMRDKVKLSSEKSKVGISFRDLNDDDLNNIIFNSAKLFSDFYLERGFTVVIYYQVERDYGFNKRIFENVSQGKNVVFNAGALEWADRDFYNEFFSVISNRLHVLLLAQIYESIPVGLTDQNPKTSKINNIYKSIDLDKFIYESVQEKDLKFLFDNKVELLQEIREVNLTQYKISKELVKHIFE